MLFNVKSIFSKNTGYRIGMFIFGGGYTIIMTIIGSGLCAVYSAIVIVAVTESIFSLIRNTDFGTENIFNVFAGLLGSFLGIFILRLLQDII